MILKEYQLQVRDTDLTDSILENADKNGSTCILVRLSGVEVPQRKHIYFPVSINTKARSKTSSFPA